VAGGSKGGEPGGLPEALRSAIERTFAATAGPASETRERAQELLDEATRRGHEAREAVARRGQEARDASAGATARLIEALQDMRLATKEDVREVRAELRRLRERVAKLERAQGGAQRKTGRKRKPQAKAEG
jgi:polyhydroxyalkanoate synthesis regulator phasin